MAVSFLQRRNLDPFSDAARFPTLQSAGDQIADASTQHAAAIAGGPNSVAARFDPLNSGSVFSRQQPGAFDAAIDQQRQQDPSNNFYNGVDGLQRRSGAARNSGDGAFSLEGNSASASVKPLDAIDSYALTTGYQSASSLRQQQGMNSIDRYVVDTNPTLRKRLLGI